MYPLETVQFKNLKLESRQAVKLISSVEMNYKKMCFVNVTSSGTVVVFIAVTIGHSEESKRVKSHNRPIKN